IHFVAVKTVEQQAALMLHKTRDLIVRQRTMLLNALRGHLADYGVVASKGPNGVRNSPSPGSKAPFSLKVSMGCAHTHPVAIVHWSAISAECAAVRRSH